MSITDYVTPKLVTYLITCAVISFATFTKDSEFNSNFEKSLENKIHNVGKRIGESYKQINEACEIAFPVIVPQVGSVYGIRTFVDAIDNAVDK